MRDEFGDTPFKNYFKLNEDLKNKKEIEISGQQVNFRILEKIDSSKLDFYLVRHSIKNGQPFYLLNRIEL